MTDTLERFADDPLCGYTPAQWARGGQTRAGQDPGRGGNARDRRRVAPQAERRRGFRQLVAGGDQGARDRARRGLDSAGRTTWNVEAALTWDDFDGIEGDD